MMTSTASRKIKKHLVERILGGQSRAGEPSLIDWLFDQYHRFLYRQRTIVAATGKATYIHPDSEMYGDVRIGDHTRINGPAYIHALFAPVVIGKWCAIGHHLRVLSSDHATHYANMQEHFQVIHGFQSVLGKHQGSIEVGDAVWIGDNVTILSGATIGPGCVVGAAAVVTDSLPPFAICVGVPAKPIRRRFSEQMTDFLMSLRWWDWDTERVKRNRVFFETDLTDIDVESLQTLIQ